MTVSQAISNYDIGTKFYVIKEIDIRWGSIRFYNTGITPATYVSYPAAELSLYGDNTQLIKVDSPQGTKNYPDNFFKDESLHCFLTAKEAEVWKVVELQGLDDMVAEHLVELEKKTTKKLKDLKKKINIQDYIDKYPDELLKVL